MSTTHKNSYKVWIRRKQTNIEKVQKDIPEYIARSKKFASAYWESKDSRVVGSGLTESEKKLLLPDIIGVMPDEREWKAKSIEFYTELATNIPAGEGQKLEIGLEKDNSKPVSENNMPLNLMDYIRYRHIKDNPKTAASQEEAKGNMLKEFYIFDPNAERLATNKKIADRDEANAKYASIKGKPDMVNALLISYGVNPDMILEADRVTELSERVQKNPEIILTAMKDESLLKRATIRSMVEYKILVILDSAYYIASDKTKIGSNEDETIIWFSDSEKNGNTITLLLGLLQEAKKKLKRN